MVVPRLERELALPVGEYLQAQGYEPFYEVHFNGRIADVIAVRREEVVAVELKLRDIRTAQRQALAYQVGCHRTYVGLPLETALAALRRHRHTFETAGTGLLAVHLTPETNGEPMVRELLPARTHEGRFLPFLAHRLAELRVQRG